MVFYAPCCISRYSIYFRALLKSDPIEPLEVSLVFLQTGFATNSHSSGDFHDDHNHMVK